MPPAKTFQASGPWLSASDVRKSLHTIGYSRWPVRHEHPRHTTVIVPKSRAPAAVSLRRTASAAVLQTALLIIPLVLEDLINQCSQGYDEGSIHIWLYCDHVLGGRWCNHAPTADIHQQQHHSGSCTAKLSQI